MLNGARPMPYIVRRRPSRCRAVTLILACATSIKASSPPMRADARPRARKDLFSASCLSPAAARRFLPRATSSARLDKGSISCLHAQGKRLHFIRRPDRPPPARVSRRRPRDTGNRASGISLFRISFEMRRHCHHRHHADDVTRQGAMPYLSRRFTDAR